LNRICSAARSNPRESTKSYSTKGSLIPTARGLRRPTQDGIGASA
jgi:hypothetical protein